MVKEILDLLKIKNNETRFIKPPQETYAVYHDSIYNYGADNCNLITVHDYTIELYSYEPDQKNESAIENVLNSRGIEFTKQERYWLEDEQLYQVIYEFSYVEKLNKEG